jgi:hypothetical protein
MSHSRYHCTTAHIMSSNHTLSLHRLTSNSSSTTHFLWVWSTENRTCSADCLQDNSSARTPWKAPSSIVKNACLQLRCLTIDILLLRAFVWRRPHRKRSFLYFVACWELFTEPLPGNACSNLLQYFWPVSPNIYVRENVCLKLVSINSYTCVNSLQYLKNLTHLEEIVGIIIISINSMSIKLQS